MKYVIDTANAVAAVNRLSESYKRNATDLGILTNQYASAKNGGKSLLSSFVQINAEGQRVTTTLRQNARGIKNYEVRVAEATLAQKRFAETQRAVNKAALDFVPTKITPANQAGLEAKFGAKGPDLTAAVQQSNALNLSLAKGNAALGLLNNGPATDPRRLVGGLNETKLRVKEVSKGFQELKGVMDRISNTALATVIYRGLSLIQQGLSESISSATDFYTRVALIQGLAQGSGISFREWANEIRRVSDELGAPIVDVAKAAYDGLSTQLIKTTRDFRLLEEAIKLSKIADSDTTTSLNVLSSVINGFSFATSEANIISDKFAKTIDLGNVNLGELNETLGRGVALARNIGVSFDEVLAGLATITPSGVSAAEAMTLLNNVMVQLSKPNETLLAELKALGFVTAEQAIQTLGFAGTLDALSKRAENLPNGLSSIFTEIRSLRGAASLSGAALKQFDKNLALIGDSAGTTNKSIKILQENAGGQFTAEMNKIKNFFTDSIGGKFLENLVNIGKQFGGIAEVAKVATVAVGGATAGFLLLNTSMALSGSVATLALVAKQIAVITFRFNAATAAANVFGASVAANGNLRVFGAAALAASLAYVAVDQFYKRVINTARDADAKLLESAQETGRKRLAGEQENSNRTLQIFDKSLTEQSRKFGKYVQDMQRMAEVQIRETEKVGTEVATNLQNSFDVLLGVLRTNISKTEQDQEKSLNAIKKIQEEAIDSRERLAENTFRTNLGRIALERDRQLNSVGEQTQAINKYRNSLVALTEQRIADLKVKRNKAIDQNDIDLAKTLNNEIQSVLSNLQQETFQAGAITRPLLDGETIQRRIVSENEAYNALLKSRLPLLKQEADNSGKIAFQEKQRAKQIEDLLSKTAKFSESVVKDGAFTADFQINPQSAIEQLRKLQNEVRAVINQVDGLNNEQVLKNFGISKEEIDKLFQQQQENLSREINLTKQAKGLRDLTEAQRAYGEVARASLVEINKLMEKQLDISNKLKENALRSTANITSAFRDNTSVFSSSDREKRAQLEAQANTARSAANFGNVREFGAAIERMQVFLDKQKEFKVPDAFDPAKLISSREALDGLRASYGALIAIEENNIAPLQKVLTEISNVDVTNINSAKEALNQILQSSFQFKGIQGLDQTAEKLAKIVKLLQMVQSSSVSGRSFVGPPDPRVKNYASGGVVGSDFLARFLSGAFKRGTDVQPAMLTPGERVISKPQADKYATLLDAIQANRAPIYRAEGSPMAGSSIGNIYVSVPAGSTSRQVKAFAQQVRRAAKQGTVNLGYSG